MESAVIRLILLSLCRIFDQIGQYTVINDMDFMSQTIILPWVLLSLGQKKIYVSALKKLDMVGRHNILFYKNILYRYCIFHQIFTQL